MVDALGCLALSTLCFSQARSEALFSGDWGFYNRVALGAPVIVALLLNLVGLAAVGFLGVRVMRRARRPGWSRLAAVAAAAALMIALNFVRITHPTVDRWTEAIGRPGLLAVTLLVLAASFGWPRPALRAIRRLALIASPLAVLTLAHGLWTFLEVAAGPVWRRVDPAPLSAGPPSLRRVVWLVLEELDQRILFEARPTGLALPEIDRLRQESLYADAARPPAGRPEVSMPALITGRPVVAVAPTGPNDLELTFRDGKTLGQTLWNQWGSLVPPVHVRRLFSQTVAELGDLAIRTAADGRFGLVLLHVPLPRPPGIYDRAGGRLTTRNFTRTGGGYLDNLALADVLIADLRRAIERARLGDRTWLVVSGDGWWREAERYDGHTDHRVPFLVRPPEGGRATHVDAAFNTLATHDLVLAILRGSIMDTSDAATWLTRNPVAPPRRYTREGLPIY